MSTRWQIIAKMTDGKYGCIYVHHDGYPSYALKLLKQHYTDQQKIDQLIALGDCSSVMEELDQCTTYASRGEDWRHIKPSYANDPKSAGRDHAHGDEEYQYIWNGNNWE